MKLNLFRKFLFVFFLSLFLSTIIACKDNDSNDDETKTPTTDNITEDNTSNPTGNVGDNDDSSEENNEAEYIDATVYFHYKRNAGDYTGWNLWLWETNGAAIEGKKDDFGLVFEVDLTDEESIFYHATSFGYIFRLNEWDRKDKIEIDRFVDLTQKMVNADGEIHLYSWEGVETMYLDENKTKPICFIKSFQLDEKLKSATLTTNTRAETWQLFRDGEMLKEGPCASSSFVITLGKAFVLGEHDYVVRVDFGDDNVFYKDLFIGAYYDSDDFVNNYTYEGSDLGVTVVNKTTTFKLWAPISHEVSVQIYKYGHPTKWGNAQYPGDNKPMKEFTLTKGEKGVWSVTVNENLYGLYYTYTVVNGATKKTDIVDPYAKATGVNSLRGYICDFDSINKAIGWERNYKRPYTATQLVVYETHVRDLTMDSTWNGTEAYRGTFLGMAETGTTYTQDGVTVKTGFDHIKELGVNAVQILPFFDQANDETDKDQFNWGYNPQTYNALEGQYSTNPYDAEVRIHEFKQMMMAYQEAGIEIIMDVVYNHVNGVSGSSFDMIIPGYYYRYVNGELSNGSGCGNETASERQMVQNFIVDSTTFLASEYNLSGFRFDLMALHDMKTMERVASELHKIDENIVVYGEPWASGSTPLGGAYQAALHNGTKFNGYGGFNNELRDTLKGESGNGSDTGWVHGDGGQDAVFNSMTGLWKGLPSRQINYVSCHDNNTLADKLYLTGLRDSDIADANVVTNGVIFMSEGINFILNGDELLRSKPLLDKVTGEILPGQFSHNSYNLPDKSNSIKWNLKVENHDVFEAYKAMIAIATSQSLFHFDNAADCANYTNVYKNAKVIQNKITKANEALGQWDSAMVIFTSATANNTTVNVDGNWKVGYAYNTDLALDQTVSGSLTLGKYSVVILYQE